MSIEDLDTKQELGRWLVEFLEGEPLPPGAVQGLQQAITPGKWTELALENGWTSVAGYVAPSYRTTPGGGIALRGPVTRPGNSNGVVITTLPPAVRPATDALVFSSTANLAVGELLLLTTGALTFFGSGEPGFAALDGLTFWPGS